MPSPIIVAPRAGARIETLFQSASDTSDRRVAPRAGARIETSNKKVDWPVFVVAPRAGGAD